MELSVDIGLLEVERSEASVWREQFPGEDLGLLHLARFQGALTLFHRAGLAKEHPRAWAALDGIAERLGSELRQVRREKEQAVGRDRRRMALALTVAAGLMWCIPAVMAESAGEGTVAPAAVVAMVDPMPEPQVGGLSLSAEARRGVDTHVLQRLEGGGFRIGRAVLAESRRVTVTDSRLSACQEGESDRCVNADPVAVARIESELRKRAGAFIDESLSRELRDVAEYYSQYPEVIRLFDRLAAYSWRLPYAPGKWLTEPHLEGGRVKAFTVHFDLGTAARMHFAAGCEEQPACTAMPADASPRANVPRDSYLFPITEGSLPSWTLRLLLPPCQFQLPMPHDRPLA